MIPFVLDEAVEDEAAPTLAGLRLSLRRARLALGGAARLGARRRIHRVAGARQRNERRDDDERRDACRSLQRSAIKETVFHPPFCT